MFFFPFKEIKIKDQLPSITLLCYVPYGVGDTWQTRAPGVWVMFLDRYAVHLISTIFCIIFQ